MQVENMMSPKGNRVLNQFIIKDKGKEYFQSYSSLIAIKDYTKTGKVRITLDNYYWNYSRTTSKYRNMFLNETTQETKKKIKEGIYKLANLNKYKGIKLSLEALRFRAFF